MIVAAQIHPARSVRQRRRNGRAVLVGPIRSGVVCVQGVDLAAAIRIVYEGDVPAVGRPSGGPEISLHLAQPLHLATIHVNSVNCVAERPGVRPVVAHALGYGDR